MWLYMMLFNQYFDNMMIKVDFDVTLTFDLNDQICILFIVVDYIVVHVKLNSLLTIYSEI